MRKRTVGVGNNTLRFSSDIKVLEQAIVHRLALSTKKPTCSSVADSERGQVHEYITAKCADINGYMYAYACVKDLIIDVRYAGRSINEINSQIFRKFHKSDLHIIFKNCLILLPGRASEGSIEEADFKYIEIKDSILVKEKHLAHNYGDVVLDYCKHCCNRITHELQNSGAYNSSLPNPCLSAKVGWAMRSEKVGHLSGAVSYSIGSIRGFTTLKVLGVK